MGAQAVSEGRSSSPLECLNSAANNVSGHPITPCISLHLSASLWSYLPLGQRPAP